MKQWIVLILVLAIGVPLLMPFLELAQHAEGWQVWTEGGRVAGMAWNTARLVRGTCAEDQAGRVPRHAGDAAAFRPDLPAFGMLCQLEKRHQQRHADRQDQDEHDPLLHGWKTRSPARRSACLRAGLGWLNSSLRVQNRVAMNQTA